MAEYKIKFGTDGWRGIIGQDFTFKNVSLVSYAIADYINSNLGISKIQPKVAVGYDTRFLSDKFALKLSSILTANNIKVILSDRPIPTPCLSFTVKKRKLSLGVMITASHNPPEYNGIKIKTQIGAAAGVEITDRIEEKIKQITNYTLPAGRQELQITKEKIKTEDLTKDYIDFLRSYIDLKKLKKIKGLKVLVDAMYGSGNSFIACVLKDTNIKLEFIRNEINPTFKGVNPEPVLENLKITQNKIKEGNFNLGLVLDGDADRIAAFDEKGNFIHPQKILGLLILHLVKNRKLKGIVVKTIVGTNLIDNITKELSLKLYSTPVGFKYISNLMEKEDILIGGEEAGGIGFKNYIPERDGTLAGLLILEMIAYENKPIGEILKSMESKFGKFYYEREDLKIDTMKFKTKIKKIKSLKEVLKKKVVQIEDFDGIKLKFMDNSWLMFRASGTEPLVRIYSEAKKLNEALNLINFGKKLLCS